MSFPGGSDCEKSACNEGNLDLISGSGRSPGGGNGNPLQYSPRKIPWTEEPGGLHSRSHKESDTTEQACTHLWWSTASWLWRASVAVAPQALEIRSVVVVQTSLAAPGHVGSSQIRDRTHVSCSDMRILYHWATREATTHAFKILEDKMFLSWRLQSAKLSNVSGNKDIFDMQSI